MVDDRLRKPPSRTRSSGLPRAFLDRGALYIADTTGWRRDLFRFMSSPLVFEVLNAGLDDDPTLLDPKAST